MTRSGLLTHSFLTEHLYSRRRANVDGVSQVYEKPCLNDTSQPLQSPLQFSRLSDKSKFDVKNEVAVVSDDSSNLFCPFSQYRFSAQLNDVASGKRCCKRQNLYRHWLAVLSEGLNFLALVCNDNKPLGG